MLIVICKRCKRDKAERDFDRRGTGQLYAWCRDCFNERRRERYAAGDPKLVARGRKTPEMNRLTSRRYRQRHPDRVRLAVRLQLAARRGVPSSRDDVRILLDDPCAYCGGPGGSLDHIVPLSDGGGGEWENLAGVCRSCNSRKHTRSLLTFLLVRGGEA